MQSNILLKGNRVVFFFLQRKSATISLSCMFICTYVSYFSRTKTTNKPLFCFHVNIPMRTLRWWHGVTWSRMFSLLCKCYIKLYTVAKRRIRFFFLVVVWLLSQLVFSKRASRATVATHISSVWVETSVQRSLCMSLLISGVDNSKKNNGLASMTFTSVGHPVGSLRRG